MELLFNFLEAFWLCHVFIQWLKTYTNIQSCEILIMALQQIILLREGV